MAQYGVPDQYIGKTLKQIRNENNLSFDPSGVAAWAGIDENTPLTSDIVFNAPDDPGSAGVRFLKGDSIYGKVPFKDEGSLFIDKYMEATDKIIADEQKLAEQLFGGDNAFAFDEYSAKRSAEAQYEPYYNEMLADYLGEIGIKRESVEGDNQLLQALRTTPEGTAGETTRAYERAVEEANAGFAGKGMFFSGTRKRKLGQAEVEREQGLKQQATDITQQYRDIFGPGRAYETAVEGGIETRKQEAAKEYYTPRIMQYQRQFPTEGNVLGGYVPQEFLRY